MLRLKESGYFCNFMFKHKFLLKTVIIKIGISKDVCLLESLFLGKDLRLFYFYSFLWVFYLNLKVLK